MLSSMMLLALGPAVAITLVAQAEPTPTGGAAPEVSDARQFRAEPTRTGKERLGGKASDEQRVDNCNVPPDLRGPRSRPDCGDGAGTRRQR